LNALYVADDSHGQVTFLRTAEFTVERNHLNVLYVANDSHSQVALLATAEFTVEINSSKESHECPRWRETVQVFTV